MGAKGKGIAKKGGRCARHKTEDSADLRQVKAGTPCNQWFIPFAVLQST